VPCLLERGLRFDDDSLLLEFTVARFPLWCIRIPLLIVDASEAPTWNIWRNLGFLGALDVIFLGALCTFSSAAPSTGFRTLLPFHFAIADRRWGTRGRGD
jgi:hypothetical protein